MVFILDQVGEPGWPFGLVKAQIRVCDTGEKTIDSFTFSVNNDGGSLHETNIEEIRWYDSKLELDLRGADDEAATIYVLNLKK